MFSFTPRRKCFSCDESSERLWFGIASLNILQDDLSRKDRVIQLGFPPGRIDVLTSIDGVTWAEVNAHCETGRYGDAATKYISRADLIRNKRAAGRPQDIADATRLEELS